jgi:hypothetical protein
MKKAFLTFFVLLGCSAVAFGLGRHPSGVLASKEFSPGSKYPAWVFSITPAGADSVFVSIAAESGNYDPAMDRLTAFKMRPAEDGRLQFSVSKLRLDEKPEIMHISIRAATGSPVEYSRIGSLDRIFSNTLHHTATLTTDYFDLAVSPDGVVRGDWYQKVASISDPAAKVPPVTPANQLYPSGGTHTTLTFEETTTAQVGRNNIASDMQIFDMYGRNKKSLGTYTTRLMYEQYAKELKIVDGLRISGITFEAIGGSLLLFSAVIASAGGGKFIDNITPEHIAAGGGVLAAVGLGLHLGGVGLKNRTYKRFFRENDLYSSSAFPAADTSCLNFDIGAGGVNVSYNF